MQQQSICLKLIVVVVIFDFDCLLTEINECASNPCQNGATCVDVVHGFVCQCANGYEGGIVWDR